MICSKTPVAADTMNRLYGQEIQNQPSESTNTQNVTVT
jgi:hypothetical protein